MKAIDNGRSGFTTYAYQFVTCASFPITRAPIARGMLFNYLGLGLRLEMTLEARLRILLRPIGLFYETTWQVNRNRVRTSEQA